MVLPDFFLRLRNQLLSDARFLSLVQSLPVGRWIARRKSSQLFDIVAGFSYSQVLFACVELCVFECVGTRGVPQADLVRATGLSAERCTLLVKAAVALGLLECSGDVIFLGPHGAALLAQPWIMRLVEHHIHFYRDIADPVTLLRGGAAEGELRAYWSYGDSKADKSRYTSLMAASQRAVAEQILRSYDFRGHRRLLDVGGGAGTFLQMTGAAHAHLDLNLFDLPGVTSLAAAPGAKSVTVHAGDFRRDPLPVGMDIVTLVRVIHDHDDDAVMDLLRNIRSSVAPGATLLIAEPFSGQPAIARVTDSYFNLYFAAMGQGRTRTPKEIAGMAARAGFDGLRQWPTPLPLIAGVMSLHAK